MAHCIIDECDINFDIIDTICFSGDNFCRTCNVNQ